MVKPQDLDAQFEEALTMSNPDLAFDKMEDDEEKDENGLTGSERAKIIKEAQRRYQEAEAYWSDQYEEMFTDWEFFDGTQDRQWSERMLNKRKGKPVRTINQLPKFVARIVAETRKTPPSIKLNPRESGDKLKAQIGSGLIRYIEDVSGAKFVYSQALQHATIGGFGWFRATFTEAGRILIKGVKDPFMWLMDPNAEEADGSDSSYFIRKYSKNTGERKKKACYEYWWADGEQDDNDRKVYWAIIEGGVVVEYGEFPSRIIPIFPVIPKDLSYRGERTVKGLVRDLRDPQANYNFNKSSQEETMAMTPKPFVMAEVGTIPAELYPDWRRAGINLVEYQAKNASNTQAIPPNLAPLSSGALQYVDSAVNSSMQDMREVSGIYDSALGAPTQELSGKAILAKAQSADNGQFEYTEALQRSMAQLGKCLLHMIKPVMGDAGSIRILGEDGVMSMIDLGVPQIDPITGKPVEIDLDFSEMDLSVSSGLAYATRREAASQTFQDIIKALPETGIVLADLAVGNIDAAGAEEGARRLKALFESQYPQMKEMKVGEQMPADQLQQQLMVGQQQIQTLTQQLQQLQQENQMLAMKVQKNTQDYLTGKVIDANNRVVLKNMDIQAGNQEQIIDIMHENEMQQNELVADAVKASAQIQAEASKPIPQAVPNSVSITTIEAPKPEPVQPLEPWTLKAPLPFNVMGQ